MDPYKLNDSKQWILEFLKSSDNDYVLIHDVIANSPEEYSTDILIALDELHKVDRLINRNGIEINLIK